MRHLTPADYTRQPWKNGKGVTVEMLRIDRGGQLLARLSRATVVEDGPFSVFPGIMRNLTVLTGKGFRLIGPGLDLRCDPLLPVAFPGDTAVAAIGTNGEPSDDFNVMTAAHLRVPEVTLVTHGTLPAGGLLALYALAPARVNGHAMVALDLVLTETSASIDGGPVLAARLHLS
ncbi:MAG: HutD family protein [Rhodobacter sp.]|jgi:environmental stress-induced protein Ves|nr:HutD family protein [Rhodobacter sp.]